jgi:hypothetical protein
MSGPGTGLQAQCAIVTEAAFGTYLAPTRMMEFVSESMKLSIKRIVSKGLRAGRRLEGVWLPGETSAAGDVTHEFSAVGMGLLLQHCIGGTPAKTGSAPTFTYTFTPGDLPVSATMQLGKPTISGVVEPFSYTGCRVNTWELALKAGELLTLKPSWVAANETTAQPLVTWTDPGPQLLSFVGGSVSVGGTSVNVADFSIKGDNKLDATRFRVGAGANPKQQLENSWREITGTFTADFESLTQYALYQNASEMALTLLFNGAAIPSGGGSLYNLAITTEIRYEGDTPTVAGPAALTQPLTFAVVGDGASDAAAFSAVLTTSDTAF